MDPFSAFYRCENILARSGSPSGKRSCTNKTAPVGNLRARKDCLSIMSGHFFTQSQLGQRRTASSSSRGSPLDDRKPSLKPKSSEKRSSSSSRHVGLDLLMKAIEEQDEPLVQQSGPFPSPQQTPLLPSITSLGLDRYIPLAEDDRKMHITQQRETSVEGEFCYQCGTTETPKWRRGFTADGHSSVRLCNACGIRSSRECFPKASTTSKVSTTARTFRKICPSVYKSSPGPISLVMFLR